MTEEERTKMADFRAGVDAGDYTTESYSRRVDKPWGYEIHFTPDNLPYMGKMIHINEGKQLSLQVHDVKRESWYLAGGKASVIIEDSEGEMVEVELQPEKGYTCALGQMHRLKGGQGGGDVFEVSTPELGNTYRVEDDYNRATETEDAREQRNQLAG